MKQLLFLAAIFTCSTVFGQRADIIKAVKDSNKVNITYRLSNLEDVIAIQLSGTVIKDIDLIEGEQSVTVDVIVSDLSFYFTITLNTNKQIITTPRTFKLE